MAQRQLPPVPGVQPVRRQPSYFTHPLQQRPPGMPAVAPPRPSAQGGAPRLILPPQHQPQQMPQSVQPAHGMGAPVQMIPEATLRGIIEGLEHRLGRKLEGLGAEQLQQVLSAIPQSPFTAPGTGLGRLSALGDDVVEAIRRGLCIPYFLTMVMFIPAGTRGKAVPGQQLVNSDGPFFISRVRAFAQISDQDPNAAQFPISLIKQPAPADCDPNLFQSAQADGTFSALCKVLFPTLDARGVFIPVGSENCELICCGTEACCFEQSDADGVVTKFTGRVPITLWDHPDCLDGTIELFTNSCGWQFAPFPVSAIGGFAGWGMGEESPDCLEACGVVNCNQVLSASFVPTRAPLFDTFLYVVYEGFRVLTCGPSCTALTTLPSR